MLFADETKGATSLRLDGKGQLGTSILDHWQLTQEELDEIVAANPSLRGMMLGYVREYKLRKIWFSDARLTNVRKEDDHDRTQKGDLWFTYRGVDIIVEVKSLQTHTVKSTTEGYTGKFQCDASDRRLVVFPNGESVQTTCLRVGEFDLLAVGLFEFGQQWRFAFAKNLDLPHTRYKKYKVEWREHLLATMIDITLPLQSPFQAEPWILLDAIVQAKQSGFIAAVADDTTAKPLDTPVE